jgi:hypothetical protein
VSTVAKTFVEFTNLVVGVHGGGAKASEAEYLA